jgi:hypothetical protein
MRVLLATRPLPAAPGSVPSTFDSSRVSIADVSLTVELDAEARARSVEELELALARERRFSRALREVGNALGATLDLDDLLELILHKLTDLVEADRATLYLLDDKNKELVSRVVTGENVKSIRMKVGHGIAGRVAQTGRPIRVVDAYKDARFADRSQQSFHRFGFRCRIRHREGHLPHDPRLLSGRPGSGGVQHDLLQVARP